MEAPASAPRALDGLMVVLLVMIVVPGLGCCGYGVYLGWKPTLPVPAGAYDYAQRPFISGTTVERISVTYSVDKPVDDIIDFYRSRGADCSGGRCSGDTFLARGHYDLTIRAQGEATLVEGLFAWESP